jgi:four helix bundle protein
MRRAAVSIPSNIAEGAARQTPREFIQYLHVSQGSLSELDTQVEIAERLVWLKENDGERLESAMNRMDKMLSGLIRHQKSSHPLRLTLHENSSAMPKDKGVR